MSNVFVIIKMCYVHNQWYDISCGTLCIRTSTVVSEDNSICLIVNSEYMSVERKINVQAKIIFFRKNDFIF